MSNRKYLSNVVGQDTMRAVQSSVLQDLSNILINSFGPKGSNTCIKEINALNMYTKDGFTILKHLNFNGIIEQSIKDDIESITKNVATTVGDGTTSAVLLANFIFEGLLEYLNNNSSMAPSEVLSILNECCENIKKEIVKGAEPVDLVKLYDVAYISSNGNAWIADTIINIYKKIGDGVFIDVAPSLNNETSIKYYDGMTINTGYSDTCFVTDSRNNTAVVDNPSIFFFEDPIDTKEMGVLFDAIISKFIVQPLESRMFNSLVPTVIVCPSISRDMSSTIDRVINWQNKQSINNKIPFLLISGTHQIEAVKDIMRMCGGKPIYKYIDSNLYKKDVEQGIAPTPDTIEKWAGHAAQVVADSVRTKFINPSCMRDENGEYTNEYKSLLNYIETQITMLKEDGEVSGIGNLKRRLHSLRSNLVEINVGGITVADRDSNRHLFEDAVLNCRSADENGIGWGANFSALLAINKILTKVDPIKTDDDDYYSIYNIIHDAYVKLVKILYESCMSTEDASNALTNSILEGCPLNLRNMKYDHKVRSSIESDCIILSSVAKIIGIMVTCNQFIVPTPQHNVYSDLKEVKI